MPDRSHDCFNYHVIRSLVLVIQQQDFMNKVSLDDGNV